MKICKRILTFLILLFSLMFIAGCTDNQAKANESEVPTLKTCPNDVTVVTKDINNLISIRRLTPRECFRLMGWCDEDINRAFKIGVLDTQLYKMAGNSIVVNCLTEIFKNLNEIIENV
jgi:site-specific DNA-cytosine methylase